MVKSHEPGKVRRTAQACLWPEGQRCLASRLNDLAPERECCRVQPWFHAHFMLF